MSGLMHQSQKQTLRGNNYFVGWVKQRHKWGEFSAWGRTGGGQGRPAHMDLNPYGSMKTSVFLTNTQSRFESVPLEGELGLLRLAQHP